MKKILILLIILLSLTACNAVIYEKPENGEVPFDYAETLFDASYVHEIDVRISEEDWEDLLENPTLKTKYHADVTIDDETVEDVSFAVKGNLSLSSVSQKRNSDRYSFKINFTKFNKDNSYHGLNKLHLNNSYCDITYMKDVIAYSILKHAGVETPLNCYVWLKINGQDFGLYLAIEEVGKSWLQRNGLEGGNLYKPEPGDDLSGYHSATMVYLDDEIESYPDIFENNETPVSEEDERRLIAAIKKLSQNGDMEECLDTEEVIRYFVGHNFLNSYDSYTGRTMHNYYLYEKDGKMSVYPWDYNLAFAGYQGFEIEDDISQGIDSPLGHPSFVENRPLWAWIVDDEAYLNRYHEIFDELISSYFESGAYEKEIDDLYRLIRPYVEKDPTAFHSVEKFDLAVKTLKTYCLKRAQSIRKQLNGELSSITELQDPEDRIPTEDLNIKDMGCYTLLEPMAIQQ